MNRSTIIATVVGTLTVLALGTAGAATAADTSPSCPMAYQCLQTGTDPQVPYGTDPSVPYGTGAWNSPVPFGRGSSSDTGGAY